MKFYEEIIIVPQCITESTEVLSELDLLKMPLSSLKPGVKVMSGASGPGVVVSAFDPSTYSVNVAFDSNPSLKVRVTPKSLRWGQNIKRTTDYDQELSARHALRDRQHATEAVNPEDVIKVDVPLFIRLLEYAREDAKTDMDLHNLTERLTRLSSDGTVGSMADYDDMVAAHGQDSGEPVDEAAEYNKSHGTPFDRGGADAWYHRKADPSKYTDPDDRAAYLAGYKETYDEEGSSGGKQNESLESTNLTAKMASSELVNTVRNAKSIYATAKSGKSIPPWAVEYIALANDHLESIQQYMATATESTVKEDETMKTGNQGYDNMMAVVKAVKNQQDATFDLGGEPVTLEYPEARFLAGKYKAFVSANRQEEFLKYMADPVAFDRLMRQLRNLIDKQKNFKGSVPGEREVEEGRTETKNEKGEVVSWKDEGEWEPTAGKDSRGKVTHLSDLARRETEKLEKKDVAEAAPTAVRFAAGAVGAAAGAGTGALLGSIFGSVPGAVIGAGLMGPQGAKAGTIAADAIWDKVASFFGGDDKAHAFADAHLRAASKGEPTFDYAGKEFDTKLTPAQVKPAISALGQVAESKRAKSRPVVAESQNKVVKEGYYYCGTTQKTKLIPKGYEKLANGFISRK